MGSRLEDLEVITTKLSKTESALKESEERFKILSNFTKEGIIIQHNGLIIDANRAVLDMFGYKYEEVLGSNIFNFLTKNDVVKATKNYFSSYKEPIEYVAVNKKGKEFPIEIEIEDISYKGKSMDVVLIRDITRRKQQFQNIETNFFIYKNIYETAIKGIIIYSDYRIKDASNVFIEMMGYEESAEIIGKKLDEIGFSKDYIDIINKAIEEKDKRSFIVEILAKDGYKKALEANILFLGIVDIVVISFKDVSYAIGYRNKPTRRKTD